MKRAFLLCSLLAVAACAPQPPPPVTTAPPPPSVQPQSFLVFFDWNKDNITPDAQQILAAAASAFKSGAPVTVQVTGFTDTSGSATYNQRLSERRAANAAAVLAQDGIPQSAMVVTGRGQNDLRVPTPDGVREPQNRRVEIVEGGAPPPPPPPQ